ncbi:hypothetical protein L6E12_09790 [Actinokineospora sp. PR83]|uniref:hypothetical protein n=1 Tax=Actinokineospora sp. PR83 TaxID=2884908 RepID=UPI001F4585B6|nr:hypothetical protein [Actinokineospora sp. PR83]MCG8916079.1 hypothetical protein [Actinokineospora sp. PR83]
MKRSLTALVFALLGFLGIGLSAGVAGADPLTPAFAEICNGTSGCVTANISFSNRSATVVGNVFDDRNSGSTTAVFDFYTANGYYSTQTRTAANERRSFNFTEPGPVGGINLVRVWLVANATGAYTFVADVHKP